MSTQSGVSVAPGLLTWTCHKKVKASKILEVTARECNSSYDLLLDAGHKQIVPQWWHDRYTPQVGGYFIAYEDGYASYSPAKAFEEGYTLDQA